MIDVLIVEDNPQDVRVLVHILNGFKISAGIDFDVQIQTDGALALDYLFKEGAYAMSDHVKPSLIILDLKLPSVDGYTILEQLKCVDSMKSIPVIVLTGMDIDAEKDCMDLNADDYLCKENSFELFNQKVCTSLLGWLKPLALNCADNNHK